MPVNIDQNSSQPLTLSLQTALMVRAASKVICNPLGIVNLFCKPSMYRKDQPSKEPSWTSGPEGDPTGPGYLNFCQVWDVLAEAQQTCSIKSSSAWGPGCALLPPGGKASLDQETSWSTEQFVGVPALPRNQASSWWTLQLQTLAY